MEKSIVVAKWQSKIKSIQPVKFKAESNLKLKFKIQAGCDTFFTETGKHESGKNKKNLDFSYWA